MPDTQIYKFFLDNGPGVEGTFLFERKISPNLRPQVGDSITIDLTFERYRITRDEIALDVQNAVRITDDTIVRITDQGVVRVTGFLDSPDEITHNYFITPSNNPNRIASWTTNKFEEDQTLRQLFR